MRIALERIVAAGQDADGAIYVLDRSATGGGGDYRAFVGREGTLVRRRVLGSGESNDGSGLYVTVTFEGPAGRDDSQTLFVFVAPSGDRQMGIRGGDLGEDKNLDPRQPGAQPLTVLDESVVRALPAHNLPGEQVLEYMADVEGERRLVVIRPRDDVTYEDFRLFFGPSTRMSERLIESLTRAKDGGTTSILFLLDGQDANVVFPTPLDPNARASLRVDGQPVGIVQRELDITAASAFAYTCR